jgi:ribulose-5-phosphate 4-epimerase/fuculose-1-phosphate aldolase
MSDTALRVDLAAAHRLALRMGLNEGLSNHFSARLESDPNCFLLTPLGLHWSEICASALLVLDGEGRIVEGEGEVDPSAFLIHSRILQSRTDVSCVLHTHQPFATAIAVQEGGRLLPVSQLALRFHERVAYLETYRGAADNREDAEELARALGDKAVLFHAHHGVITAANSVARAFDDLYFLEQAARLQILAQSAEQHLRFIPAEVGDRYAGDSRANSLAKQAVRHYAALKRVLDRDEPDYTN